MNQLRCGFEELLAAMRAKSIGTVVSKTLAAFSKIDILINNAGSARAGSFLNSNDEVFVNAWNLKLLGYIRLVKAVIPDQIQRRDGRIVNIDCWCCRTYLEPVHGKNLTLD